MFSSFKIYRLLRRQYGRAIARILLSVWIDTKTLPESYRYQAFLHYLTPSMDYPSCAAFVIRRRKLIAAWYRRHGYDIKRDDVKLIWDDIQSILDSKTKR